MLLVLKDVCEVLSQAEGATETLAPHQLFDVIGGVGTGGWLAILLGRYKLRIDQCMSIYIDIVKAIDPTRKRASCTHAKGVPAAIDQARLIQEIDRIIDDYGKDFNMMDPSGEKTTDTEASLCRAFAVGVIKHDDKLADPDYRIFRSYQAKQGMRAGPPPTRCKVSDACAATAAAKDFAKEFNIYGTTYFDDNFPNTHNVSRLALDEAAPFFGENVAPEFILNISPGIPSEKQIMSLQEVASKNGPAAFRFQFKLRRAFSADGTTRTMARQILQPQRARSEDTVPSPGEAEQCLGRPNTSFKHELKHQNLIREYLAQQFGSGCQHLYHRLDLGSQRGKSGPTPYLNDIAKREDAIKLADSFLKRPETQQLLTILTARCKELMIVDAQRPRSASPAPMSSTHLPMTAAACDHAGRVMYRKVAV